MTRYKKNLGTKISIFSFSFLNKRFQAFCTEYSLLLVDVPKHITPVVVKYWLLWIQPTTENVKHCWFEFVQYILCMSFSQCSRTVFTDIQLGYRVLIVEIQGTIIFYIVVTTNFFISPENTGLELCHILVSTLLCSRWYLVSVHFNMKRIKSKIWIACLFVTVCNFYFLLAVLIRKYNIILYWSTCRQHSTHYQWLLV